MFWHKREQANDCIAQLLRNGVRAELVIADNDPKLERRERQIAAFDQGEIDVLVNMFILTEGFDSPSLKTVWVRDSGKPPTIQMAGRVFRKYPGIPFKQVVQSKGTRWPIHRTATPTQSFVWMEDKRWAGYKLNPNINRMAARMAVKLLQVDTKLPDYLQQKRRGRNRPVQLDDWMRGGGT